jgi:putative spermidine/putrescine transport system permease protein
MKSVNQNGESSQTKGSTGLLSKRKRQKLSPRLNVGPALFPALIFFVIFLIVPMAIVIYYSLQPNPLILDGPENLSLNNYVYFFERSHYVKVIFHTLRLSVIATAGSLLIGYGAALILRKMSERIGNTAVLLLAFPILSGPIVVVMGWMLLLTSKGFVGRGISIWQTILGLPVSNVRLLGTDFAVIIGMIQFNLAFVILNLLNVMLKIQPTLEEASMNLGATRWQTFFKIIWPLSLPGVLSASLIAFALSMNSFVNPIYLGNRSRYVMTTLITNFMFGQYNWQMASATSVILLFISLIIILLYNHVFTRAIKV